MHFIETRDPEGPVGAKGVGEAPAICTSAAIANALYNATGVRFHELPLTPEKVASEVAAASWRRRMKRRVVLSMEQALSLSYATMRFAQLGWRVIRLEATPGAVRSAGRSEPVHRRQGGR